MIFGSFLKQKKKKMINKSKIKKIIKDKISRNIRTFFEQEKGKRCNNNYIEYDCNGDKNRNLSLDEYLSKLNLIKKYNNLFLKF